MLTYKYECKPLYKLLNVYKGEKLALMIFDWYGLSEPNNTVNAETTVQLSKEDLDEVGQVLKNVGMRIS